MSVERSTTVLILSTHTPTNVWRDALRWGRKRPACSERPARRKVSGSFKLEFQRHHRSRSRAHCRRDAGAPSERRLAKTLVGAFSHHSSFVFRRATEVIAQEHPDDDGHAFACGWSEMHLADGRRDGLVQTEPGPAYDLDASDLAVRADLDGGVNGRLGPGALRLSG